MIKPPDRWLFVYEIRNLKIVFDEIVEQKDWYIVKECYYVDFTMPAESEKFLVTKGEPLLFFSLETLVLQLVPKPFNYKDQKARLVVSETPKLD